MKSTNKLTSLLNIDFPLIQGGMVWISGWKLASAVANNGCLGVLGAGSMKLDILEYHLDKLIENTQNATGNIAVNLPLLYSKIQEQIDLCLNKGIKIFITSAGSPKLYTKYLKDKGCVVLHVTSTPELALKCEKAGVDGVILEGFEAGGHNGRDELTSLVLLESCRNKLSIPYIIAGGFSSGQAVKAAIIMGASGVQMGTRFMMSEESSAHIKYKKLLEETDSQSTKLVMKKHVPVRLVKNQFYQEIEKLEESCASKEQIIDHLGKGRAKQGMLEGNLIEGELEAGQVCTAIQTIKPVKTIIEEIKNEYYNC